jgi:hypothetical protein
VVVAQGPLDRRVSRHAPESRRRAGGDRGIELRYASAAQFFEAVARSATAAKDTISAEMPLLVVRFRYPFLPTALAGAWM